MGKHYIRCPAVPASPEMDKKIKDAVKKVAMKRSRGTPAENTNMPTDYIERLHKAYPPEPLDSGFICSGCAERLGGVWPKGHVATMHAAECPYCGIEKSLANVGDWDWGDWDWPDKKRRGMRD